MLDKDYITSSMRLNYILSTDNLSTNEATFAQFIRMVKYIKKEYPKNYDIILNIQCGIKEQTIKDLTFTDQQFRYLLDLYLGEQSRQNKKELYDGISIN